MTVTGASREGVMRRGRFLIALVGVALLCVSSGCAGPNGLKGRKRQQAEVIQTGESASREYPNDAGQLWQAATGAVREMGFTSHSEQAKGIIATDPLRWEYPGASKWKTKDYRGAVSVQVKEQSVSVQALWGKKSLSLPKRDATSSEVEQKLLQAWFEAFERQLAALPKKPVEIPSEEPLRTTPVEPGKKSPPPPVTKAKPVNGKPAVAEKRAESREQAAARLKYAGTSVQLSIETPKITPLTAAPGGLVVQSLRYTVLSPLKGNVVSVKETIVITDDQGLLVPLVRDKMFEKEQGTHSSVLRFLLPKDIPPGEYRLQTTITAGEAKTTASATFKVPR